MQFLFYFQVTRPPYNYKEGFTGRNLFTKQTLKNPCKKGKKIFYRLYKSIGRKSLVVMFGILCD